MLPAPDLGIAEACQSTLYVRDRPARSLFDCPAQTGLASGCTSSILNVLGILIILSFVQPRVFVCCLALFCACYCYQATDDSVFCCANKTVMSLVAVYTNGFAGF